jgi:hypothetical protein
VPVFTRSNAYQRLLPSRLKPTFHPSSPSLTRPSQSNLLPEDPIVISLAHWRQAVTHLQRVRTRQVFFSAESQFPVSLYFLYSGFGQRRFHFNTERPSLRPQRVVQVIARTTKIFVRVSLLVTVFNPGRTLYHRCPAVLPDEYTKANCIWYATWT